MGNIAGVVGKVPTKYLGVSVVRLVRDKDLKFLSCLVVIHRNNTGYNTVDKTF